ncbi:MAG: quinone oxidoreductase family protein [Solirubrobacteraceae bacterium]
MRALQVHAPGGPDALTWSELPDPVPGPGEAAVAVRAAAVSWADTLQRDLRYRGGPEPPFVAGHDLAGEVVALGEGVSEPPVGSRVWSVLGRPGAFAEIVTAPANWFHPLEERLSYAQGAALGSPSLTADTALVTVGRLAPGETVLVNAAAGGVGTVAVQLARSYGAGMVIGACGGEVKAAHVRAIGADHAIDYTAENLTTAVATVTGGHRPDLILDSVGGEVLSASIDCMPYLGRLVSYGAASLKTTERLTLHTLIDRSISVAGFQLYPMINDRPQLLARAIARIQEAVATGALQPVVWAVFPARRASAAFAAMEQRRVVGRAIIDFAEHGC